MNAKKEFKKPYISPMTEMMAVKQETLLNTVSANLSDFEEGGDLGDWSGNGAKALGSASFLWDDDEEE